MAIRSTLISGYCLVSRQVLLLHCRPRDAVVLSVLAYIVTVGVVRCDSECAAMQRSTNRTNDSEFERTLSSRECLRTGGSICCVMEIGKELGDEDRGKPVCR